MSSTHTKLSNKRESKQNTYFFQDIIFVSIVEKLHNAYEETNKVNSFAPIFYANRGELSVYVQSGALD